MVALCLILFVVVIAAKLLMSELLSAQHQGRPVSVKRDARCVIGKVGEGKNAKRGILIYCIYLR